ncbi:hypothetical protein K458DRAFT_384140 [Lentithecium fluviatile CBS 122367]|uniref:Uncharacterized protein n=1 Tax=Lentithecium fluviatile CBS 122367 TaxID=1168545 RepID=A0A6G1JGY6_9PLEO|nr:hypothetical protein K458DRAFT_384140 [Lentithecium fluviatile CBS 122367]
MPPKKRSIRDFFAPVQKDGPTSQPPASKQPAPKTAPVSRAPFAFYSKGQNQGFALNSSPPLSSSPPRHPATDDAVVVIPPRKTDPENPPPTNSQSSGNSAGTSKRTVSNGEEVVLNSDSDSDLPAFDWDEPTTKPKPKPMARTTRMKPNEEALKDGLRKPPPRRQEGVSFSRFVETVHQHVEKERKIAEVKAHLEKPLVEETPSVDFDISEDTLAAAVNDEEDPDKAKRLFQAMERTNAMHSECVFHFFEEGWNGSTPTDSPFPMDSLPNHRWTSSFEEQSTRDQAFLSGYAERVFRYQQLPDELASWMIDQVCFGRNDVLNEKYIQLLDTHHHQLQTLLGKVRLDSLFQSLGIDPECLNPLRETAPSYEPHPAPKRQIPTSLKWVCKLLQTAAPRLQIDTSRHAFYILLHLCMDHSVNSDVVILHALQDSIEALMCSITDNRNLASLLSDSTTLILARIRHPVLQRNLVCSLPTKSPLAAYFQRHLALSFLLYPKPLGAALDSPEVSTLIFTHLEDSPDFRVTKGSNYMSLAARLTLLDVAIGPGLTTVPYYPLTSPGTSREGSSPITAPGPQSSEEKTFNNSVGELAHQIMVLSQSIVETGNMTDLSRLEAKDYSERLIHRLENAVRIGGKKLINIFSDDDQVNGARMMSQWLGFKGISRSPAPLLTTEASGTDSETKTGIAMMEA